MLSQSRVPERSLAKLEVRPARAMHRAAVDLRAHLQLVETPAKTIDGIPERKRMMCQRSIGL
jgi:hypothetical protein